MHSVMALTPLLDGNAERHGPLPQQLHGVGKARDGRLAAARAPHPVELVPEGTQGQVARQEGWSGAADRMKGVAGESTWQQGACMQCRDGLAVWPHR